VADGKGSGTSKGSGAHESGTVKTGRTTHTPKHGTN
jgi:hypothetical protein